MGSNKRARNEVFSSQKNIDLVKGLGGNIALMTWILFLIVILFCFKKDGGMPSSPFTLTIFMLIKLCLLECVMLLK